MYTFSIFFAWIGLAPFFGAAVKPHVFRHPSVRNVVPWFRERGLACGWKALGQ